VELPDPSAEPPRDRLLVKGGARLRGTVPVSGSARAAGFLLAAALLSDERDSSRYLLRNVPDVGDVRHLRARLVALGLPVEARGGLLTLGGAEPTSLDAGDLHDPGALPRLAALLGRWGAARLALPNPASTSGAAVDAEPASMFDLVAANEPALRGLSALGADVRLAGGTLHVEGRRLRGGTFTFPAASPTATATLMLAAVRARGRTALENCSLAPEVEELGRALNKMGARVHGAGTALVSIEGVDVLEPIEHTLLPDRIEAGTLMLAAAITRGDLLVRDCTPEHLSVVSDQLRAAHAEVSAEAGGVRVRGSSEVAPVDIVVRPHPGVPAALASSFLVLMARARGESVVSEVSGTAVLELTRLGLDVTLDGARAIVRGPRRLKGGRVTATEPALAAALVLAGLAAEGTTEILRISHLDRRYERLDKKLKAVGADLRRARATPAG
jgi:UDP-N-acetylglucosamine 1-carboxyvinyltransferase